MNNAYSGLAKALAVSLVLHAALIAAGMPIGAPIKPALRPAPEVLTVSLREPLVTPVASPPAPARLLTPREPQQNPSSTTASATRPRALVARPLQGEIAIKATEQVARDLYYPPEAIERGLQGDALVLLFLDGSGTVIAVRLEGSSGHALLDDAALRAARSLRALPPGAPRETLLPVRFRLR